MSKAHFAMGRPRRRARRTVHMMPHSSRRSAYIPDGNAMRAAVVRVCRAQTLVGAMLLMHAGGRDLGISLKAAFVMTARQCVVVLSCASSRI